MTEIGEDRSERKVCQVLRGGPERLWGRLTKRLRDVKRVVDHELGFGKRFQIEDEELLEAFRSHAGHWG